MRKTARRLSVTLAACATALTLLAGGASAPQPATAAPAGEAAAAETGAFYLNDAWSGTANQTITFGQGTDEPLVGDWNRDNKDTPDRWAAGSMRTLHHGVKFIYRGADGKPAVQYVTKGTVFTYMGGKGSGSLTARISGWIGSLEELAIKQGTTIYTLTKPTFVYPMDTWKKYTAPAGTRFQHVKDYGPGKWIMRDVKTGRLHQIVLVWAGFKA